MTTKAKYLLIGAGAVGQVYGYALAQSGAEITFFIKEKHLAALKDGIRLYPHGKQDSLVFDDFSIQTDADEVAKEHWQQVWLCVPSNALEAAGLQDLLRSLKADVVVNLLPGFRDTERVAACIGDVPQIRGVIPFCSYAQPYPGGPDCLPGMAFWQPWGAKTSLAGDKDLCGKVVACLKRAHNRQIQKVAYS